MVRQCNVSVIQKENILSIVVCVCVCVSCLYFQYYVRYTQTKKLVVVMCEFLLFIYQQVPKIDSK